MKNRNRLLAFILACCMTGGVFMSMDRQPKDAEKVQVQEMVTDSVTEEPKIKSATDEGEDFDQDGITNEEEVTLGTNSEKSDSDKDGIADKEEIEVYDTDPTTYDADGDGLSDGDEILLGLDPNNAMTDGEIPAINAVMIMIPAEAESVLIFHIGSTEKSVNPVVANKLLMYEDVYPLMRYPKMKHAAVKTNDSARLLMMRVLLEAPISLLVAFSFARVVDKATLRLI